MRGAAHHSKMGSDMATREFGRQGGLVRGFLGVARHGGCSRVHLRRFPKVLRIAPELGDRESSKLPDVGVIDIALAAPMMGYSLLKLG